MDLGATICTAARARLRDLPAARGLRRRRAPARPSASRSSRPSARARSGAAPPSGSSSDGHVLLHRRPAKGLLGGMRALPSGPWQADDPGLADAPVAAAWTPLGTVGHVFTHFALDLAVVAGTAADRAAEGEWWPIDAHRRGRPADAVRQGGDARAEPSAPLPETPHDRPRPASPARRSTGATMSATIPPRSPRTAPIRARGCCGSTGSIRSSTTTGALAWGVARRGARRARSWRCSARSTACRASSR